MSEAPSSFLSAAPSLFLSTEPPSEAPSTAPSFEGEVESTIVGWSGITATLIAALAQTTAFYIFFMFQRSREKAKSSYSLYEPRQFNFSHRSPSPFADNWMLEAWKVDKETLRRSVGLDSYMYLRFLRLGARISGMGVLASIILLPVYATGLERGDDTVQFNQLTLARVLQGSDRIWGTVLLWWIFIAFILNEFWKEWMEYQDNRRDFLAKGDPDGSLDMRYALLVEELPASKQSDEALAAHFEAIFPNKVRQATVLRELTPLEQKIAERQVAIENVEKAEAFIMARPEKPRPTMKINSKVPCMGETVDKIDHNVAEYERLNKEIDQMRKSSEIVDDAILLENAVERSGSEGQGLFKASTTGVITFTSLSAKESAMAGHYKGLKVFAVADPEHSILWQNATVPYSKQRIFELVASALWTVGILFWAVPVTLVVAIANLDSIFKTLGLRSIDSTSAAYGIIAGLLPVIALAVLMAVLYMSIVAAGQKFIKFKSAPEVDAYTFHWHMLFQFANLWLILIGGSFFNQVDAILADPTSIVGIIAGALPGASVFFANMLIVKGIGNFGLELSMLPAYGLTFVMSLLAPESQRTQRMLDASKTPPEIKWGQKLPDSIFVFLVMILYMPIVPLMELFAFIYFGGMYIVWTHQCLHVYAQASDGGGVTTWQTLFGFLIVCLYMGEAVFIVYMGLKEAPGPAACGFVPLVVTIIFHKYINQKIVYNIGNLALDVAAEIDKDNGELERLNGTSIEDKVFGQPALKLANEEREPMPYRRSEVATDPFRDPNRGTEDDGKQPNYDEHDDPIHVVGVYEPNHDELYKDAQESDHFSC
ncbi:unnamed protein product [Cylindrotheca closterium]|uniref:CSC1/OSCA1-like 7TM region domain-containing protein n=1 Tax=Cylindrotheca closterium TaxID=2856 RepID=A0AAD2FY32_9STRA|nr:unnamed protein product [Cylindrotheca closterium]